MKSIWTGGMSRVVTFGGALVEIEHAGGNSAEIVNFVFARFPVSSQPGMAHARLRLTEDPASGVFTLTNDHGICCVDSSAGAVASWLLHDTCRQVAAASAAGRTNGLLLHAAAVQCAGGALLLPGASGSGKSTVAAFLTSRGFHYLTDELVHVPAESVCVEGFAAPLKVKRSGIDVLERHASLSGDGHLSLAGVHDVLVLPVAASCATGPASLSAIVFPGYQPDSQFRLKALSPAQTGLRLMAAVLNGECLPDHGFREVARLAGATAGYAMRYASLPQIEAHLESLRRLVGGDRRPARPSDQAKRARVAPN